LIKNTKLGQLLLALGMVAAGAILQGVYDSTIGVLLIVGGLLLLWLWPASS